MIESTKINNLVNREQTHFTIFFGMPDHKWHRPASF